MCSACSASDLVCMTFAQCSYGNKIILWFQLLNPVTVWVVAKGVGIICNDGFLALWLSNECECDWVPNLFGATFAYSFHAFVICSNHLCKDGLPRRVACPWNWSSIGILIRDQHVIVYSVCNCAKSMFFTSTTCGAKHVSLKCTRVHTRGETTASQVLGNLNKKTSNLPLCDQGEENQSGWIYYLVGSLGDPDPQGMF